ncbi:MAG TPA: BadF/BadG/BcrA/BcrD ATPase family protein [Bacteroidota bacterium]
MKNSFVIGIDGGGTRTRGAVADITGTILSEKEAESSNVHVVGYQEAAKRVWALVRNLTDDNYMKQSAVRVVVAGLAGVGRPNDRKLYLEALRGAVGRARFSLRRVHLYTDAEIALAGAFGGSPGIVVIAGTGSIVMGKDEAGVFRRVGGWGRDIGDEGSGYQIGRRALAAVAKSYDGRSNPTALTDLVLKKLKLADVPDLVEKVSRNALDMSTLAPLVLEAAKDGDKVAEEILKQAADELVLHVRALLSGIQVRRKVDVVFSGGLIDHANIYSEFLERKLISACPQVSVRPPLSSPLKGAIHLALSLLEEKRLSSP